MIRVGKTVMQIKRTSKTWKIKERYQESSIGTSTFLTNADNCF